MLSGNGKATIPCLQIAQWAIKCMTHFILSWSNCFKPFIKLHGCFDYKFTVYFAVFWWMELMRSTMIFWFLYFKIFHLLLQREFIGWSSVYFLHSYVDFFLWRSEHYIFFDSVPEVISLPITGGNLKYLEWIKNSTREKWCYS